MSFFYQLYLFNLLYLSYLCYTARINDDDPGFEKDHWMKKRKKNRRTGTSQGGSLVLQEYGW